VPISPIQFQSSLQRERESGESRIERSEERDVPGSLPNFFYQGPVSFDVMTQKTRKRKDAPRQLE